MVNKIKIAFIESSIIVSNGLSTILKEMYKDIEIVHFKNLQELSESKNKSSVAIAIINSTISKSEIENIYELRNSFKRTKLVGCVSTNYHRNFSIAVDNVFYINDDLEKIKEILFNCFSKYNETTNATTKKSLSKREIEVLKYLAKGNTNKEIANKLNISIHTVVSHRRGITHKLEIKSIASLTIYAISNNFIDIEESSKALK